MESRAVHLWDRVSNLLRDDLSTMTFDHYFRPLSAADIQGEKLVLQAPNHNVISTIQNRYLDIVTNCLHSVSAETTAVDFVTADQLHALSQTAEHALNGHAKTESNVATLDTNLNPAHTFDTFVVGRSNQFAHAATKGVAESPGKNYNPLFIYSGSGLGKTHLLHAIGNLIVENNPQANVVYITSERFTNELITSLQTGKNVQFRELYRNVDALLVDDIQFIADKSTTQEEFFHTFNTLHEQGKQIVITSDKPPKEIPALEHRLKTRFEWGLIADMQSPDFETRVAILRKKAELEGMDIGDGSVMSYIAEMTDNVSVRTLEGMLTRVMAYAALTGQEVDMQLVEEALKDYFTPPQRRAITPALVQKAVCEYYGLTMEDLNSRRKSRDIARPRQIGMYITRNMTDLSLPNIGEAFGGRDHTTVMHACDKIADEMKIDPGIALAVEDISKRLTEQ